MSHRFNINFKLVGLALAATVIGGLVGGDSAEATGCDDAITSCVEVNFGTPQGDLSVQPGLSYYDSTKFYLPVEIGLKDISLYTIKVYGSGSDLVSGSDSIPTIGTDTAYLDLGKNGSEWGMRWNFGDTVNDRDVNYHKVPASSSDTESIVVENQYLPKSTAVTKKQLTLGFAVAVDGNQPSGSYTNTITVAVVASPRDARSIFDISTMQEMSPDICENTTTPNTMTISTGADINATGSMGIDTNGDYPDSPNYVPQVELTDSRDGKKYTIRKLADGNCWMVSNLEFDFVPTSAKGDGETPSDAFSTNNTDTLTGSDIVLTKEDTDLNSMDTWTPAISVATYGAPGTVYKTQKVSNVAWSDNDSGTLRSFSNAAGYPDAVYATKTDAAPSFGTASTGELWQRYGNLYNWTAATLGSGTKVTTDGQDAEDSICPRGWKLPNSVDNDSYTKLLSAYGFSGSSFSNATYSNQLANFPLNFMRAGFYDNGRASLLYRNSIGYWWTSTTAGANSYYLYIASKQIWPNTAHQRSYGFNVRCVARK